MPKMHLGQLRFTHSACEPFIKNKERIQQAFEIQAFEMTWLIEITKIYPEERLLMKF